MAKSKERYRRNRLNIGRAAVLKRLQTGRKAKQETLVKYAMNCLQGNGTDKTQITTAL